ncbi:uncharacterized protein VNE69_06173 [Vairimorpha necatrix]|uniref:Uncharacterized protein n=1 Tax=Vairimorpha necatrix TaxID=6039 RepID=A0AAX4JD22_9MICR
MEYTLCSSSSEEGEISPSSKFPSQISTLSYAYYPNSCLFIGDNSIPRQSDFHEVSFPTKIKKRLNRDFFDIVNLCRDKSFFDNKFVKQTNSPDKKQTNSQNPDLHDVVSSYKEIINFHVLKKGIDLYLDLFNKLVYHQNKEDTIFLKDSILTKVHMPNIFVHFKILKHNNIFFEDSYFKSINVYEYLEMSYEEICKEYKSTEERWYKYKGYNLVIFSSSCFKSNNKIMRYFNGLDCDKNYLAVFDKQSVKIKDVDFKNDVSLDFLDFILSLNLEVGDYAHNQGEIYKIGIEGEHIPYEGIDYTLVN